MQEQRVFLGTRLCVKWGTRVEGVFDGCMSWRAGIGGGGWGGPGSRRLDKRRGVKPGSSNWEGALEGRDDKCVAYLSEHVSDAGLSDGFSLVTRVSPIQRLPM